MHAVDLHLHLLPGVDDGARDERAALEHARRLIAAGVSSVTVTPHINTTFGLDVHSIPARTAALQALLDAHDLPLQLHPGGELHRSRAEELSDAELDVIAQGPPGARWVLFEVPFRGIDDHFVACCAHLRARGYAAVIAHPERAERGLDRLRGPLADGAVLQVNVDSLLGAHGRVARRVAERLVRGGGAYVVASDGHPGSRDQTLADGLRALVRLGLPPAHAVRLVADNPRFLLREGIPALADLPHRSHVG
jgi:protein-tyrosine phosphatase